MRVLVAGCAGFIGYHLCERLLREGHRVFGIDDFCTGQRQNVADLQNHEGFRFFEADIARQIPLSEPCERVYDLACPASPTDFGPRRMKILDVCSRGVWNLLDYCREHGARILHASTSEVYGDPAEHPQRESYWGNVNPIGKRACYDEGKRFAEALITNYSEQFGVATRLARIFHTYGPRMRADDGRVLPTFISQAFRGEPITVQGDGMQTRSFCYVQDLVDGLMRLCESDCTDPVNLGNPVEITILEFAREIIALCGSRSEIRHLERAADDPRRRKPDITRARERLGWQPRVDRATGLRNTVEWFRGKL